MAAEVALCFADGPRGPALTSITGGAGPVAVADSDFFVVLDGAVLTQADLRYSPGSDGEGVFAGSVCSVVTRWCHRGPVATLHLVVTAHRDGVRLDQAGLWRARLAAPVRLGAARREPPADLLAPVPGVCEAHPVWIGDGLFAGIDWPVAENACGPADGGETVLCREFPGVTLAAGASWTSHSLTIGAAAPGRQAEAFAAHLDRLRGRPARRASFYFDWLTHASEGPTEGDLGAMVALLERLAARDGVAFDIYALDDGAVETRWSLYWDRHRLRHRQRFPHGLAPAAARLAALGTDLGIWIGPDGFGPAGDLPRAADLTAMIRDWNVSLLKIDTCVSWPWTDGDPAANDAFCRRFTAMLEAVRRARPDLVAINHRVTGSPYVLAMLDSTLWEGAESYPDVFLNNTDRPRLHTRYAAYGRGLPTYYGAPSALLEDHGVCFNGDPAGWRREVCVGAFGRALALSPELYGTLFVLPDEDYADLGRALALARAWRPLLEMPGRRTADGDFVHADGRAAILVLVNDAWTPVVRRLRLGPELGLSPDGAAQTCCVLAQFPERRVVAEGLGWGDGFEVGLEPFEALALEVRPGPVPAGWASMPFRQEDDGLVLLGPSGEAASVRIWGPSGPPTERRVSFPGRPRLEPAWIDLGSLDHRAPVPADAVAAEACRFAISNDPAEWQVLSAARPTTIAEVAACRAFFARKLRYEGMGVAANAWDGDERTAWGDAPHWRRLDNLWRLDLGDGADLAALEIDLADFGGGPVFADGDRHGLTEPVWIEASADLVTWRRCQAHVFPVRNAFRTWPGGLVAEFPPQTAARFLRLRVRGIAVRHLRVLARTPGGERHPLDPSAWRGSNLFGDAPLLSVHRTTARVGDTWPGRTAAVVVELARAVPLQQEACLCWAELAGGNGPPRIVPATAGSPRPLFHGWECDAGGSGPGFVWRLPVTEDWIGRDVGLCLGWLGARARGTGDPLAPEVVRAHLLSDHSPLAEVRV